MSNNDYESTAEVNLDATSARRMSRGRRAGARNWTEMETDQLLDAIEQVLPTGAKQWEKVALLLHQQGGQNQASRACT